MPEFDSNAEVVRRPPNEIDKCRKLAGKEIRPHLDEYWSELVTHLSRALEERLRSPSLVAQSVLVGDLLRHLQRKHKSLRSAVEPASYRRRRRRRVEGGIHFHRIERARVNREKIGRPRARRIERPDPGVIVPALRADVNLRGHGFNRKPRSPDVKSGKAYR